MSKEAASSAVDWSTFGADLPLGWLATFDGRSLEVRGESAHNLATVASTERWTVHFDGLLHNKDELSATLGQPLVEGKTQNAELIGHAFDRWGKEVITRLLGVYSVLIWDKERNELLAARDRLGIFPLFYATREGRWHFSNSLDALRDVPEIRAEINRSLLISWIAFVWPIPNETAYENILRVRNGHVLTVRFGHATEERYWDLVHIVEKNGWITEDELKAFPSIFQQAIDSYLELGEPALYLSGGLDSVSVAAFAADICRKRNIKPPRALSIEFPEDEINESSIQRSIAEQLGMPQWLLPLEGLVGPQGVVRESLELCSTFPSPSTNIWRPAYVRLGTMATAEGRRVLLSGAGGDEWLGVTPVFAADLMKRGDLPGIIRLLRAYYRSFSLSRFSTMRNVLWRFSLRPMLGDLAASQAAQIAPSWLAERQHRHWKAKYPSWLAPDPHLQREIDARLERYVEANQAQRYSTTPYLREMIDGLDHIVGSMDQESIYDEGRRIGAPILSPFLNAEMVEFLARTPPDVLNAGGRAKGLVRSTLAERFPSLGFERQKKVGIGDYFRATLFPEMYRVWHEIEGARALAQLGVVNATELEPAMEAGERGDTTVVQHWQSLYLLYIESWARRRIA